MKIHFLRHGPTHSKRAIGWTDLPADLSDTGLLSRISENLPEKTLCISSDLKRASDTLTAVLGERSRLKNEPRLREFHFGDWEDRSFAEISSGDPDLSRDYWSNPGTVSAPNGESWNTGSARMSAAVDELCTLSDGHDILVACHFGVILTQLARFANVPPKSVLSFSIDPLSLTTIELLAGGAARVERVNHVL